MHEVDTQILGSLTSRLRVLRNEKQLNQDDLATALGVSVAAYSKIETGRTNINYSRLSQLSAFYRLSITELLGSIPAARETDVLREDLAAKLLQRQQEIHTLQKLAIELYDALKPRPGL